MPPGVERITTVVVTEIIRIEAIPDSTEPRP